MPREVGTMRPGTMLAATAARMAAEGHVSSDDREDFWVLDWTHQSATPKRGVSVGIYNESTLADLYQTLKPNKKAPSGDGSDRTYDETYARLLKLPEAELAAFWRKHLRAGSDAPPYHVGDHVPHPLVFASVVRALERPEGVPPRPLQHLGLQRGLFEYHLLPHTKESQQGKQIELVKLIHLRSSLD